MIRLLIDQPADGVTNMSRDEALLASVSAGAAPPTVRFYQWSEPTISLGYFQRYADFERLPAPAGELACVRRTTGGGAILHDQEWTYSIALPTDHHLLGRNVSQLYDLMHDAIIEALGRASVGAATCGCSDDSTAHRGPFFCFERRHCSDVVIGTAKVAGSAQRRTTAAVLQHGSIVFSNNFEQHPVAAVSDHARVTPDQLLELLIEAVQRSVGCEFDRSTIQDNELALVDQYRSKHEDRQWLRKY